MADYTEYRRKLSPYTMPYACLDLEFLKYNIQKNLSRAGAKKIRLASKSIRCTEVMRFILNSDSQFQGIMAYHGAELLKLLEDGFDDILMGYPVVDRELLEAMARKVKQGYNLSIMVDLEEHLKLADEAGKKAGVKMPVTVDLDCSVSYPGLHFGVHRSSISDMNSLQKFVDVSKKYDHIEIVGLMGYEAQVAGLGDSGNGSVLVDRVVRLLKPASVRVAAKRREEAVGLLTSEGIELNLVNGGGTGSLETTSTEQVVSEVTVGSGFYCSHLFDNYVSFELKPALFYGVSVLRQPTKGCYVLHGGGFIASGATGEIKAPQIYLPRGGKFDKQEGAGEVQSPVRFSSGVELDLGDPVFLRHAKAGELCERFNDIIVIDGESTYTWPTYRGRQWCFG